MKLYGLKNIRTVYGFTMRELGEKINVTSNTINLWEKGSLEATDERACELSHYLGIEKELLFKENYSDEEMFLIYASMMKFKLKKYDDKLDVGRKNEILKELFNADIEYNNPKEKIVYKDFYNYVFIFSNGYTVTVEATGKIEAINKLQQKYSRLFEDNFKVFKVNSSIHLDETENNCL